MSFAEMSKTLRKDRNITQLELAKALNVSGGCIAMLETGKNEPTANTLSKYAEFFDCSTDYLLERSEKNYEGVKFAPPVAETTTKEEREMLAIFRKLDHEMQHRAIGYLRRLADALVAERALAPKKA